MGMNTFLLSATYVDNDQCESQSGLQRDRCGCPTLHFGTMLSTSHRGHFTNKTMPLRSRTLYARCFTTTYGNRNYLEGHRFVPTYFNTALSQMYNNSASHRFLIANASPLKGLSKCSWYKPSDKLWRQPAAHPVLSARRYERNVMAKRYPVTRQKPSWCLQQGRKYHIETKSRTREECTL